MFPLGPPGDKCKIFIVWIKLLNELLYILIVGNRSQAATAHGFQLPADLALAAVTSTPAKALGLDDRIGYIRTGYDADLVRTIHLLLPERRGIDMWFKRSSGILTHFPLVQHPSRCTLTVNLYSTKRQNRRV